MLCEISTQISYKFYKYKALEIIIDIYHSEIISEVEVTIVQLAGAESARLSIVLERGNDLGAEIWNLLRDVLIIVAYCYIRS